MASKYLRPLTEQAVNAAPRVAYRVCSKEGLITLLGRDRRRTSTPDHTALSILRHIPHHRELPANDVVRLAYIGYLYTLRLADTRMMRRLTTVERDVVTQTKNNIFSSIELVQYKIATMRCVIQQLTPDDKPAIVRNFKECGLKTQDALLFSLLYYNNDIPAFITLMHSIEDDRFPLDVNNLSRELERDPKSFKALEKAANYFAWRKVAFIARGNRQDPADLGRDLLMKGLQAYRWVRPFYNRAHALNYAKLAIHKQALVMIEEVNKNDLEKRIIATKDGFDNIIRSLTDDVSTERFDEQEEHMIAYLDRFTDVSAYDA